MRKFSFFLIIFTLYLNLQAQDTLYLKEAHQMAVGAMPLNKNKELYQKAGQLMLDKYNANWLPGLNLNAQATYQSDVTSIELEGLPFQVDMPSPTKDQYKTSLDISQLIYDGGSTKYLKQLQVKETAINLQNLEVENHLLKNQVNGLFFSMMLIREQKKLLEIMQEEVKQKLEKVTSSVENGVLLPSNQYILQASLIQVKQKLVELEAKEAYLLSALSELGVRVQESTLLAVGAAGYEIHAAPTFENRPDVQLFNLQKDKLENSKSLLKTQRMPRLAGFGQLGYGKPGLNFLQEDFDTYYLVGAKLSWNIWDWNQNKKEREVIDLQKQLIDNKEATLIKNQRIALSKAFSDIDKYEKLIARDNEMISLYEKITKEASSQLDHGAITSTEYLTELNNEAEAKLNKAIHEIQLKQAEIQVLMIQADL